MATSFAWKTFRDPAVRRQFKVLSVLGRAALSEDKLKEVKKNYSMTHNGRGVSLCCCPFFNWFSWQKIL